MGRRTFRHPTGEGVEPCPKCANRLEFVGRSVQVSEDCCEVWVTCKCGFDPTERDTEFRLEDVWGSLDADTLACAMDCWNTPLKKLSAQTVTGSCVHSAHEGCTALIGRGAVYCEDHEPGTVPVCTCRTNGQHERGCPVGRLQERTTSE